MVLEPTNQQYGPLNSVSSSIEEPSKPKHGYRMIFITVIVILIAIGGIMVSRNKNLQQIIKNSVFFSQAPSDTNTEVDLPTMSVISERTIPWVEIVSADNKTTYTQSENITLTVNAFSGDKVVTGYDMLLHIDRTMFEVVSVTSEISEFLISQHDNDAYLAVSAIKNVTGNDLQANNTPLLKIVLKPKKTGTSIVSLLKEKENEKTQFVDMNVQSYEPQVGSLQIEVQ